MLEKLLYKLEQVKCKMIFSIQHSHDKVLVKDMMKSNTNY